MSSRIFPRTTVLSSLLLRQTAVKAPTHLHIQPAAALRSSRSLSTQSAAQAHYWKAFSRPTPRSSVAFGARGFHSGQASWAALGAEAPKEKVKFGLATMRTKVPVEVFPLIAVVSLAVIGGTGAMIHHIITDQDLRLAPSHKH